MRICLNLIPVRRSGIFEFNTLKVLATSPFASSVAEKALEGICLGKSETFLDSENERSPQLHYHATNRSNFS